MAQLSSLADSRIDRSDAPHKRAADSASADVRGCCGLLLACAIPSDTRGAEVFERVTAVGGRKKASTQRPRSRPPLAQHSHQLASIQAGDERRKFDMEAGVADVGSQAVSNSSRRIAMIWS